MTEELGVLVDDNGNYVLHKNLYTGSIYITFNITAAHYCTRKEAEHFPQFKFVPLKELEMEK
ncbi:hypothetical protein [Streptococcus agalactiae]|uniref:hypothetical protein n=1 Tax=Streptococcus agalactiae TaxID=1311 RepID=UPI0022EA3886|nr:hypothetical protein [Streptococcus agalactiae]